MAVGTASQRMEVVCRRFVLPQGTTECGWHRCPVPPPGTRWVAWFASALWTQHWHDRELCRGSTNRTPRLATSLSSRRSACANQQAGGSHGRFTQLSHASAAASFERMVRASCGSGWGAGRRTMLFARKMPTTSTSCSNESDQPGLLSREMRAKAPPGVLSGVAGCRAGDDEGSISMGR